MFLRTRLLSARHGQPALLLAAIAFALGLGVGATLGPVSASRGAVTPATVAAPLTRAPSEVVHAAHPAEVLRVLDGDTFEARIHLWPGLDITTRVRLRNIDAPELKARCADERTKAEAARDALRAVLDRGEVGISRVMLDKYGGRVVADASAANTPDVGAELIAAGLARRYSGGRRESWCP
jgi:endonuclease YncB( thermonuclease family)